MQSGAASSTHRGPGDVQPPPGQPVGGVGQADAAAAEAQQQYHDNTQPGAAQPYPQGDGRPLTPTTRPAEHPPGMDPQQMPRAHLGRGVKRDGEAADPPARRPVQPPNPISISTPTRDGDAQSPETDSDDSSLESLLKQENENDEANREPDVLKQVAEAMTGISKSIELMNIRIALIEDQRRKVDDPNSLQSIHYKDVEKPGKYDGQQWTVWRTDFLNFLERRDRRWPELLKAIDKRSIDPLNDDAKNLIGYELDLQRGTLMKDFVSQLYEYLKNYTTGEIQSRVISGGKDNSWETWRFLCDQGKSRRKIEVHEEYKRIMNPQPAPVETLMKAITQWERDLLAFTVANNDKGLDEETKKLCLENMCPEPLQDHLLDKFEQGMISTYDQYKQAVSTYVYRKTKKSKKKLNVLEGNHDATNDESNENWPDPQCHPCGPGEDELDPQLASLKKQAEVIAGRINVLVRGKFDKGAKGFGKGKTGGGGGAAPMQVDHSLKDCYSCGEIGHIAANCEKAGKGKGSGQKGKGNPKGKGKGKDGKAAGKGGWPAGKGTWQPSLQNWRQMYPGPSQQQWTSWWHQARPNATQYKGGTNLFEQGQRLSPLQPQSPAWSDEQWQEWPQPSSGQVLNSLFSAGNMYKFVQKGPKPKEVEANGTGYEDYNAFEALEEDEDEADDDDGATTDPPGTRRASTDALASLPSTCTRAGWQGRPGYCGARDVHDAGGSGARSCVPADEPVTAKPPQGRRQECSRNTGTSSTQDRHGRRQEYGRIPGTSSIEDAESKAAKDVPLNVLLKPQSRNRQRKSEKEKANQEDAKTLLEFTKQNHSDVISTQGLKFLRDRKQPEKLSPLTRRERPRAPNGWEVMSAIVDSGATITALHPEDAKEYKVEESAASRAGVTYETAGSEDLPNLGEKKIAVLTTEGTLRGYQSQVAEVSGPLESVRQLLASKHCVLFGLGENEEEHLIVNKLTGEVNRMRDDGINYLHDLLVVPPDEVAKVQANINAGVSPFGGQGNAR